MLNKINTKTNKTFSPKVSFKILHNENAYLGAVTKQIHGFIWTMRNTPHCKEIRKISFFQRLSSKINRK